MATWQGNYGDDPRIATIPVYSRERTIASGSTEGYDIPGRARRVLIRNVGPYDVDIAFSDAAQTAGHALTVLAGDTFETHADVKRVSIKNGSSGSAVVQVYAEVDRRDQDLPDLTSANGFPAYDATTASAISLGVE